MKFAAKNLLDRALCGALHVSGRDSLMRPCVTDAEFRDVGWREFPQSRPATGLHRVDAWHVLFARLRLGSGRAVGDYGGRVYEFVRFEVGSVQRFKTFRRSPGPREHAAPRRGSRLRPRAMFRPQARPASSTAPAYRKRGANTSVA